MLLSDDEQCKLLEEFGPTTKTRIVAILTKINKEVDNIPAKVRTEIEQMRAENRELHGKTHGKLTNFTKAWRNIFSHGKSEFER